jgi:hypothetical protein
MLPQALFNSALLLRATATLLPARGVSGHSALLFRIAPSRPVKKRLLSDDHFTVDGTLIEAWAGQKSFQRKGNDDDPLNPPPPDRGSNPTVALAKRWAESHWP